MFYVSLTSCVFCLFLCLPSNVFFKTYFVHNVAATVSYDRKRLLHIRTVITHHGLAELFFPVHESDEPDVNDILLSREQAQIPVMWVRRRQRKRGQRAIE